MSLTVFSTFSGIGGFDLGLERAGMTTVAQVEIDPFCRKVLTKHWPEVPKHDDVRTCVEWWQTQQRPRVDVVAGGPPCQPVSLSGLGLAETDDRWMWPEFLHVVTELQPTWVIAENVPGLRRRGLTTLVGDLEHAGYRVRVGTTSACAMGAPHPRGRLFILAHTGGEGRCPWRGVGGQVDGVSGRRRFEPELVGRGWWAREPDVGRVAYGVPGGVDRRRALGNAVIPAVAEHIGQLIVAADVKECAA
jgi:DNA (cytosine-5)-methyltransferase 1